MATPWHEHRVGPRDSARGRHPGPLTAWGLHRFNSRRVQGERPSLTDPTFQDALVARLTRTTITVLTETFLISAALAALALLPALWLRRETPAKELLPTADL